MKNMLLLALCASNALFAAADDTQNAAKEIGALLALIEINSETGGSSNNLERLENLLGAFPEESKSYEDAINRTRMCRNLSDGRTVLHLAARQYGLMNLVRKISDRCVLEARDNKGNTPLFYAYNEEKLALLLERGACPHVWNPDHLTPLGYHMTRLQNEVGQSGTYLEFKKKKQLAMTKLLIEYQQKNLCGCFASQEEAETSECEAPEKEESEVSEVAALSKGSDISKSNKTKSKRSRTILKRRIGGGRY